MNVPVDVTFVIGQFCVGAVCEGRRITLIKLTSNTHLPLYCIHIHVYLYKHMYMYIHMYMYMYMYRYTCNIHNKILITTMNRMAKLED